MIRKQKISLCQCVRPTVRQNNQPILTHKSNDDEFCCSLLKQRIILFFKIQIELNELFFGFGCGWLQFPARLSATTFTMKLRREIKPTKKVISFLTLIYSEPFIQSNPIGLSCDTLFFVLSLLVVVFERFGVITPPLPKKKTTKQSLQAKEILKFG